MIDRFGSQYTFEYYFFCYLLRKKKSFLLFIYLKCSFHEQVILQVMVQDYRQYIVCINLGSNVCLINMSKLSTKFRARLKNSTYIICFPYTKCYTMALWNRRPANTFTVLSNPQIEGLANIWF